MLHPVPLRVLDRSVELLESVLPDGSLGRARLADMCIQSCRLLELLNYGLSVAVSWTVTEVLVNTLWDGYLERRRSEREATEMGPSINAERKRRLTDRFGTYSKIEVLSLVGDLPDGHYEQLDRSRKVRNDWIHSLKQPSNADAEVALATALLMLDLVEGIQLSLEADLAGIAY
jgi:hypothetical protein